MIDTKLLLDTLIEAGALRFGDFVLKSGARSPFFFNLGDVSRGVHLSVLGRQLATLIGGRFPATTLLFGPAYKGISLVTATACAAAVDGKNWAICYDRKEIKDHGEGGQFIGHLPTSRDQMVLIDDVISSGKTKIEAMATLSQSLDHRPIGVVVVVDRRVRAERKAELNGVPLASLLTLADVATHLENLGDHRAAAIRDFDEGTMPT